MWKHRGKKIKVSLARRSIIDFMHFSQKIALNSVSAEKFLDLGPLIKARSASEKPISWYAIFLKALGQVSEEFPALRQTYFKFPWPYFFQYHTTSAMMAIEREIEGETMVVYLKIDHPQQQTLVALDESIRQAKHASPLEVSSFRRFLKINRLPFLIRRMVWSLGLHLPNYRLHYLGTFGLTGIGRGVRSLSVKSPLPINFVFDMSPKSGLPLIRLFWDHRVFDGVIVIHILERLEQILNQEICMELMKLVVKEELC